MIFSLSDSRLVPQLADVTLFFFLNPVLFIIYLLSSYLRAQGFKCRQGP